MICHSLFVCLFCNNSLKESATLCLDIVRSGKVASKKFQRVVGRSNISFVMEKVLKCLTVLDGAIIINVNKQLKAKRK